jgi:DNA-binding CsgD family transcriptional regulator
MSESKQIVASRGRQHIIKRPRLTRLLDETTARIIMLVAPAGYGKTTLARQWLAEPGRRYLWYRATAASADVAGLAAQLSRLLSAVTPDIGSRIMEHLRAVERTGLDERALTELLVTSLADWPDDTWLVVDDYHHLLGSDGAERLIQALADHAAVRLLIVTRGRASWAIARRLLYGEILEITGEALALTRAEAQEILVDREEAEVDELTSASSGWPAVIGLASLKEGPLWLEGDVPGELYEFFADELYRALPRPLQRGLCSLAPATLIDSALIDELFGAEARTFVEAAERAGFLTCFERGFELHPLLRRFLLQRAREEGDPGVLDDWGRVIDFLMRTRRWDDAFTAIDTFDEPELLPHLVDEALDDLLLNGRLDTIIRWLRRSEGSPSPVFRLAAAEVAFRQGDLDATERLSLEAAGSIDLPQHRVSGAWFRAGQAAHLSDEAVRAFRHFGQARELAHNAADLKQALWGLFTLSIDYGDTSPIAYLEEYRHALPVDEISELRLATGLNLCANRFGQLHVALDRASLAMPLASTVTDPLVRTSFLNTTAHNYVLGGRYADALAVVETELEDVERYGLGFVAPHAYLARAGACIGLRRLSDAARAIRGAQSALALSDDIHSRVDLTLNQARLFIAQDQTYDAYVAIKVDWSRMPGKVKQLEYAATRALIAASVGQEDEALDLAASVDAASACRLPVTNALTGFARAIVGYRTGRTNARRLLAKAYHEAKHHGIANVVVMSYRAWPEILASLAAIEDEAALTNLIASANDIELAQVWRQGSALPGTGQPLSPREFEVYELLSVGASNREIAQRLFISEATVKVHVRHIFEKLGVRTRTEAAVRARDVERLRGREAPEPI